MNQKTLILGLNPAWQRLFMIDKELKLGEVHRLPQAVEYASGKGINCARLLQLLGGKPVLSHFLGAQFGERIFDAMAECDIEQVPVWIKAPNRICTTLVADSETTELIEPSPQLTEKEMADFSQSLKDVWDSVPRIALCGTNPKGFDMQALLDFDFEGKRVFVDAVKDIDKLLEKGVELLKLNMDEYCELLQRMSIPQVTSSPQFWKMTAMLVLERLPIRRLVVTDEENPVRVFYTVENKFQSLRLEPPAIESVNCIGAGDSFLAGWIAADSEGLSIEECLARATATAVARCEVEQPWELDLARARALEQDLLPQIERVTD